MSEKISVIVAASGPRLDLYLVQQFPQYSRGFFQRLIKAGTLTVNGKTQSSHYAVKEGDRIEFEVIEQVSCLVPQDIPLDIVYEDADVLVLNKQPGLVVHPACGHPDGTLLNALAGHAKGTFTPMLVHRLDKDTSGIMIVAKNERAKNSLVKQFQNRAVKKVYLVAVQGIVEENHGYIEAPLGRSTEDRKKIAVGPAATKMAVTEFKLIARGRGISLLEVHPLTGRTHQIRSHMAFIKHPVLGDTVYGGADRIAHFSFGRQMLHAYKIAFTHPSTSKPREFCAELPDDMKKNME